ncbi:MAG: T9SS type A sorting domain-containing protein, partial [Crocinitomicaceae bacterium]
VAPVADLGSLPDITASCEVVSLTDPTATDNCSAVTVSNDATLPIQVASTITWTYTDAVGNFSTQTQNVVFNDLILPTASNPADSSYECVADAVIDGAVVTDAVDNCSATTVTHVGDVVSGNGCQDTITRTYKVTDGSGNFVDVVQMIYIEDVTNPTASNPTSLNVQCIGDVPAPSAGWVTDEADNCAAAPVVAFVGDVSDGLSCPETITRTFSVTDNCGNQTTVDQLIIIMDMTAPIGDIASLPALTGNCDITPSTATATDNCDGAMNGTPDMAFPITAAGTTTVTWTFTDACGNTTAQTQDVVITPVDVTTSMASDGITIVVNNNGQTYQWIDCITGQAIPGETSYNFTPTYGSEFAVIITENGCSDTSACVNSTVGIGEIGIKTLVLYPNPTNGMLTIDFEGEIKNIEVVDMLGRRVKTIVSIENKSVDATELTPGKYMIRITTENDQVLLEEFVLQN